MRSFVAMLRASITMLRRNRMLLITSLGIALISIFTFGWLFGSNGPSKLHLGVVDEDQSALSAQMVTGLSASDSLSVARGTRDAELQALRAGNRDAVLVIIGGFAADLARGSAHLQVYYDQSNPITAATTRMAVQSIVASLNSQLTGRPLPVTLDEQAVSVHSFRLIDWLTPGMLGMLLMWANLSVGATLVAWRAQGILRRLAATPLRPVTLVTTQILARLALSLAQGAILLGVAMIVFGVRMYGDWLALGATVTLGTLAMLAVGFIVGSFAPNQDVAQAITFLISFPMMFLGGSYFPTDNAPAFLTPLVKTLPLTYLNDALRQIIDNGASFAVIQTDLLVLAAWMILALIVAVRAFRWA